MGMFVVGRFLKGFHIWKHSPSADHYSSAASLRYLPLTLVTASVHLVPLRNPPHYRPPSPRSDHWGSASGPRGRERGPMQAVGLRVGEGHADGQRENALAEVDAEMVLLVGKRVPTKSIANGTNCVLRSEAV